MSKVLDSLVREKEARPEEMRLKMGSLARKTVLTALAFQSPPCLDRE